MCIYIYNGWLIGICTMDDDTLQYYIAYIGYPRTDLQPTGVWNTADTKATSSL